MGWHIGQAVVRGEIDNTLPGRTVGKIWIRGREEPVELDLHGNCWRDLAGTKFEFVNPAPEEDAEVLEHLAAHQHGVVGDITASKRVRVVAHYRDFSQPSPFPEDGPYQWFNCLYIEWFSDQNGRIFIQTDSFEFHPGERVWEMDAEEEEEQLFLNMAAMRVYLGMLMGRKEGEEEPTPPNRELSEFEWEKRLQQSDRTALAYREALFKYKDDPDSERKSAYVMGWDRLLEAMENEEDEDEDDLLEPWDDEEDWEEDDFPDEDDWEVEEDFEKSPPEEDPEEPPRHPAQVLSESVVLRALEFVHGQDVPGSMEERLVSNLLKAHTKLSSLDLVGGGYRPEIGFILAMLKRCLNYLNEPLAACMEMLENEENPARKQFLESLRDSIFEIRGALVELRREMRRKSGRGGEEH